MTTDEQADALQAATEDAVRTLPPAQVAVVAALDEDEPTRQRILHDLAFLASGEAYGIRATVESGLTYYGLTPDRHGVWREAFCTVADRDYVHQPHTHTEESQ